MLERQILGYRPSQPLPLTAYARIAAGRLKPVSAIPSVPLSFPDNCRIAVVGNAAVNPSHGAAIDAHDVVIRFNSCNNYGVSGWRVDVLALCNAQDVGARFAAMDRLNRMALGLAKAVWLTCPPYGPADHTTTNAIIAKLGNKPYWLASSDLHGRVHAALLKRGAEKTQLPSSGVLVLTRLREALPHTSVSLFGFTHQGWRGHAWEAERKLVDEWGDWITRVT